MGKRELWLCKKNRAKNGDTIFKPLYEVEENRQAPPDDFIVIEKGDIHDLNEAITFLTHDGWKLKDTVLNHSEFFSHYTAILKKSGGRHNAIKFAKHESALSSAIH